MKLGICLALALVGCATPIMPRLPGDAAPDCLECEAGPEPTEPLAQSFALVLDGAAHRDLDSAYATLCAWCEELAEDSGVAVHETPGDDSAILCVTAVPAGGCESMGAVAMNGACAVEVTP